MRMIEKVCVVATVSFVATTTARAKLDLAAWYNYTYCYVVLPFESYFVNVLDYIHICVFIEIICVFVWVLCYNPITFSCEINKLIVLYSIRAGPFFISNLSGALLTLSVTLFLLILTFVCQVYVTVCAHINVF